MRKDQQAGRQQPRDEGLFLGKVSGMRWQGDAPVGAGGQGLASQPEVGLVAICAACYQHHICILCPPTAIRIPR